MSTFQFDTSGVVEMPEPFEKHGRGYWVWSDLSPFVQGYVEAAFASLPRPAKTIRARAGNASFTAPARAKPLRFDRLHPETLAAMIRDCENAAKIIGTPLTADDGRRLWEHRALGFPGPNPLDNALRATLPPLALSIEADGKVHAREAS